MVGHHPVLSSGGAHGDQVELQQHVQPVLEKYGVQARATPKNRAAAACQRLCYPHLSTRIASLGQPKSYIRSRCAKVQKCDISWISLRIFLCASALGSHVLFPLEGRAFIKG